MKLIMGDVVNSLAKKSPPKVVFPPPLHQSLLQTDPDLRHLLGSLGQQMRSIALTQTNLE